MLLSTALSWSNNFHTELRPGQPDERPGLGDKLERSSGDSLLIGPLRPCSMVCRLAEQIHSLLLTYMNDVSHESIDTTSTRSHVLGLVFFLKSSNLNQGYVLQVIV